MSDFDFNWIDKYGLNTESLTILDIGAWTFEDSIRFKETFPQATVIAFEPYDKNVYDYGPSALQRGVVVISKAVSDVSGESIYYPSTEINNHIWTASGSLCRPLPQPHHPTLKFDTEGITVRTIRLDTFCLYNKLIPTVLHIDVQSGETQVILGMGDLRPKLIWAETCAFNEYDSGTTEEEFNKLLVSLGYRIEVQTGLDTLYVLN